MEGTTGAETEDKLHKENKDAPPESAVPLCDVLAKVSGIEAPTGIGRIVLSRSSWYKLIWSAFYLSISVGLFTNFTYVLQRYFNYGTDQITEAKFAVPSFPDVTVCNNKPFSPARYRNTPAGQRHTDIEAFHEYRENKSHKIPHNVWRALYLPSADYANVGPDIGQMLGHSETDMIVSCLYKGQPCRDKLGDHFITLFIHPIYMNCYTLNGSKISHDELETGVEFGISLILYTEYTLLSSSAYYMGNMDNQDGIVVTIHPPYTIPDPLNDGFDVLPGTSASVAVRTERTISLPQPYGRCLKTAPLGFGRFQYTREACMSLCIQKIVIHQCGCKAAELIVGPNTPKEMEFCVKYFLERPDDLVKNKQCEIAATNEAKRNLNKVCAHCLKLCNETTYSTMVSVALWPRNAKVDAFIDLFVRDSNGTQYHHDFFSNFGPNATKIAQEMVKTKWVRSHFYRLNVFIKNFVITEFRETAKTEPSELLSSVGGVFGFWAGISVLTGLEIIEFIFNFCTELFRKACNLSHSRTMVHVQKR